MRVDHSLGSLSDDLEIRISHPFVNRGDGLGAVSAECVYTCALAFSPASDGDRSKKFDPKGGRPSRVKLQTAVHIARMFSWSSPLYAKLVDLDLRSFVDLLSTFEFSEKFCAPIFSLFCFVKVTKIHLKKNSCCISFCNNNATICRKILDFEIFRDWILFFSSPLGNFRNKIVCVVISELFFCVFFFLISVFKLLKLVVSRAHKNYTFAQHRVSLSVAEIKSKPRVVIGLFKLPEPLIHHD